MINAKKQRKTQKGKTRDLFKKTGDIKGIFHPKTGTIKKQKRWKEYTEELYNKDLNNLDNHDGVMTHSEPDILECEVNWALGSTTANKTSGVMEFQQSYFKS